MPNSFSLFKNSSFRNDHHSFWGGGDNVPLLAFPFLIFKPLANLWFIRLQGQFHVPRIVSRPKDKNLPWPLPIPSRVYVSISVLILMSTWNHELDNCRCTERQFMSRKLTRVQGSTYWPLITATPTEIVNVWLVVDLNVLWGIINGIIITIIIIIIIIIIIFSDIVWKSWLFYFHWAVFGLRRS